MFEALRALHWLRLGHLEGLGKSSRRLGRGQRPTLYGGKSLIDGLCYESIMRSCVCLKRCGNQPQATQEAATQAKASRAQEACSDPLVIVLICMSLLKLYIVIQ